MSWQVIFCKEFDAEFKALEVDLRIEVLAHASLLGQFGPGLGRPQVDTLKGSKHANMKELRFNWAGGVWRVAFAFDPRRQAIVLAAGNKGGKDQTRFYEHLIAAADRRFGDHLVKLKAAKVSPKEARTTKRRQK